MPRISIALVSLTIDLNSVFKRKGIRRKKTSYIYKTTAASPVQSQEVLYVRVHTNQIDRIAKLEQPIGNRLKGCAYIYYTFWL